MQLKSIWAKAFSFIFHPLLITFYMFLLLKNVCPILFKNVLPLELRMWAPQTFFNTFLYSALVVVLLWKLDFAKNIYLRTQQERFVPLMASAIFYFWNFYVHHRNVGSPKIYNEFLLSTFALISVLFIATIFFKISLHSAAISGAFTFLIIAHFNEACISWPLLAVAALITALVMLARVQLKEHTKFEVIAGAIMGVLVQLACWAFYVR